MTRPRCVHLIDDMSLGGITKSFTFFDQPAMRLLAHSKVVPVTPYWRLAPRYDADIIIVNFPASWRVLPYFASLRARNRHAHLVHIEHSYTGAWERLKVANVARFHRLLRMGFSMFDDVVTVSRGQGRWLAAIGVVPMSKLHVVYPWSGVQGLDALLPAGDPGDGPIRLGAYGRFAEAKGFDVLIDAVKTLDPARFTLDIGGYGAEEAALRAQAAGCANIRFVGRVDDVAGFIGNCDVIVVPSRWEAFGLVAAEAKIAGRAIVVSDVDGLTEQVGDAGIAVDCSQPAPLAAALASLTGPKVAAMAAAARAAMAGSEASRIGGWARLFTHIAARRAARQASREPALREEAAPMRISAGQYR